MTRPVIPEQSGGGRKRPPTLFLFVVLGTLSLLASYSAAWAAPLQNVLRQTIPTRTFTPSPVTKTAHPSATPTSTEMPGHTRVILRQGYAAYSGAEDTYLTLEQQDSNHGMEQLLVVTTDSRKVALLRFELPTIPADATIVEAALQLHAAEWSAQSTMSVSVYRVLRPWAEHEASWLRATDADLWNLPGCNGIGTDRGLAADDTVTLGGLGYTYSFDVRDVVRDWVADPTQNYGLIVLGVEDGQVEYRFASGEHGVVSQRPALVITYAEGVAPTPTLGGPTYTPSPTPTPLMMEFQYGGAPYPGYKGVVDTYIGAWDKGKNHAPEGRLGIRSGDVRAGLIRFDLSAIPPSAQVTSAELEVYVTWRSNTAQLLTGVYRVLRPWVVDEATWEKANVDDWWGQPGCNRTDSPNPDREGVAEDIQSLGSKGISDWRYRFDVTGMTWHWVSFPDENYGLILKGGQGTSVEYGLGASRDFIALSQRPKLVVHFIAGEPTWTPTLTPTPTSVSSPTQTSTPVPTGTSTALPTAGSISGIVWHDLDGDEMIEEGEPRLAGVQVILRSDRQEVLAWRLTDSEGRYAFPDLEPDLWYRVREENPPGFVSVTGDEVRVWVSAGIDLPVDFGDQLGILLPLILKQL